jgi:threonine synthase
MLSKMEGVFPEPGAAASVAGLKKLVEKGIISSSEKVVAVVTGSGLKDITDVKNVFGSFTSVEKDLPAEELFALAQSFYKL